MKTTDEVQTSLRVCKPILEKEYGVTRLAVFGSYARSEQSEESDVDLLVELRQPMGLRFVHLAKFLETVVGLKVDLLASDAIKPNRREHIMKDLIYV
jgi:uncharacterized protein